jgi:mono/diheme cytochrome c family protein
MRHLLASIATYIIVVFLVSAAALFATVRSAQLVITDEETVLKQFGPGVEEFRWEELGEGSYIRNCENCHGAEGRGWDQYPGLNHTALLFLEPGGRDYLVDLHLYGLTSRRWGAPMPPMGHLHDIEMAAVINHVLTHFGNEKVLKEEDAALYEPEDIATRRDQALSPRDVERHRPDVPVPVPR